MSDFLFARLNFRDGFARALDLDGGLMMFNLSPSPRAADLRALASDVLAVRKDHRAVNQSKTRPAPKHGA